VSTTGVALGLLALVLAVTAIVLATIANRRWAAGPRRGAAAAASPERAEERAALRTLEEGLAALRGQVDELGGRVDEVRDRADALARAVESAGEDPTALRHVALVRYDAFADVGGRLSYSVALLDDTRSGIVLTTLAGKADVRTYVRTISAGQAEGTLTAEEQQAIEAAGRDA
jgi:hypothetical protein